jgi:predicted lipoprotein with Yx(FWY)xxD motif
MRLSTRYSLTAALAVGVAALVLAACGGGDDNGDATAANAGSGLVSVQDLDGKNVLVGSDGQALYTADVEKDQILCTDGCTSFWDPVAASARQAKAASSDLELDLGVLKRPDGESQLTLEGLPLYSFSEEGPGQLEGDGFTDSFQGTRFEWAAATTGDGGSDSGSNGSSDSSGYSSPY